MKLISFVILSVSFFVSHQSMALPVGHAGDGAELAIPSDLEVTSSGVDFTSIVALDNCSGSLVRLKTSRGNDKAMMMTNGHCYEGGMLDKDEVILGRASSRTGSLLSSDGKSVLGRLTSDQVIYGSMTNTDVALYRLTETYDQIKAKYKVEGLTISDTHPEKGAPLRLVSGYWKKIYSCSIDTFIHLLKEDVYTWKDSVRYLQPGCDTIGGTSGSPVIHAETNEVIAIHNTHNEQGERCTMDNPCEVDEAGNVVVNRDAGYGQQVYWVYGCFEGNKLDLNKEGCQLAKPKKN